VKDGSNNVSSLAYTHDLDGHLLTKATASAGVKTREYIWLPSNDNSPVDLPLSVIDISGTTATISTVHADHLGRPIRMTSWTKATVWQATWKPWGEVQTLSGTNSNNFRYPGQYFQIETGLHYNHHRHYDAVTGRYTQPDPLRFVDGPSVYAYAKNSPYMYRDSDGRFWNIVVGGGIGAAVNIGAKLYINGGKFECISWSQVGIATVAGAFGGVWGGFVADVTATAGLTGSAAIANSAFLNALGGAVIGGSASVATGGDFNSGAAWGASGGFAGGAAAPSLGASFGSVGSIAGDVFGAAVGEGGTVFGQGNNQ
jgi:RHS repeat-associated protein